MRTVKSLPGPQTVVREVLPNGIVVLVRENFDSPAVVVRGYLRVGSQDEPAELAGLAGFCTDVMERGTHRRPFAVLYEELESEALTLGLEVGVHTTTFGGKGLRESFPHLLELLADVLREPSFAPDQVEKVRDEIQTDLLEQAHDTRRMADLTFHELLYTPEHPYGRSNLGYPETIARITREDLVRFHQTFFAPQGMVLVIVGAVKAAEALQQVSAAFGDWRAQRPPVPVLPDLVPLERCERHVFIPEKSQVDLRLGWRGPARKEPDFLVAYLANAVLGVFGMMGRLGEVVREQHGLAYYVYSVVEGGYGPGPWQVIAGVDPAHVRQAQALILEEVRRLREELIPEKELSDSQSMLVGSLPLQLETNEGVARALLNIERYELGLDYLQRYRDLVLGLSPAQVQAAAQRWLDPERYALALAGPELPC